MSVPLSTYRLQLHKDFPFSEARKRIGYMKRLGVGAMYLSPILLARPGSLHGYDICDHGRINPELGSEADFRDLAAALKEAGLVCILDFVPNHMAADAVSNPWWWDILENGPSSLYREFFDIDWMPIKPDLQGKVLLPILGDQYGKVLERGEIRLEFSEGGFHFRYGENRFPMNPCLVPQVLERESQSGNPEPDAAAGEPGNVDAPLGEALPEDIEFLSILTAFRNLPGSGETDPRRVQERQREKEVTRHRLATLAAASERYRALIEDRLGRVNGIPGEVRSYDALHGLLEGQAYRLAYWRTAGQEINYRRFFDVNGLAALRMENPKVFSATHSLIKRLIAEGLIQGLRIDHVDGLYDPAGYLTRLRELAEAAREESHEQARAGSAQGPTRADAAQSATDAFYIVVEKILCGREELPREWPVQGTTGYEFLNDVNGLFVDPSGHAKLAQMFRAITGRIHPFIQEARSGKRLILETSMASELNVLANGLDRLSEADRNFRDFTLESLRDALREVIACFSLYRTYAGTGTLSEWDRRAVEAALQAAAIDNPALEDSIFDFLRTVLLPYGERALPGYTALSVEARLDFTMKFQQMSGAVQAKGVEDTAFYRHLNLISVNEVGGDPGSPAMGTEDFHARMAARAEGWPHALLATATHDTKRGEDARLRIDALSEIPDGWRRVVPRLFKLVDDFRRGPGGGNPSQQDAYLLMQSLVGCWPMGADGKPLPADEGFLERVQAFAVKAAREAKLRTSWINPNAAYAQALTECAKALLMGPYSGKLCKALFPILESCARAGAQHALNQAACKCAAPGVPDIYQGTESWDLSLVDPDNRRPVDYAALDAGLAAIEAAFEAARDGDALRELALDLLAHWPDGRVKQFVLWRCLRLRRDFPALFQSGSYQPVRIQGEPGERERRGEVRPWLAFMRRSGERALLVCLRTRSVTVTYEIRNQKPSAPPPPAAFDGAREVRDVRDVRDARDEKDGKDENSDRRDPSGAEALVLPGEWSGRVLVHVFTGARFPLIRQNGDCRLPLAMMAREFPTAWLWLEPA
ncbi:MAG: malto-oligosyltrehalose synthase [Fibrobacteria bacterium]